MFKIIVTLTCPWIGLYGPSTHTVDLSLYTSFINRKKNFLEKRTDRRTDQTHTVDCREVDF